MVHALEQIHSLIKPGGYLIDIHPDGELVEFFLLLDDRELFIGYMQEMDDYIEYRQADEAIQTILDEGLFQVEKKNEFEFRTYAESFDELKEYLNENWSDAVITNDVIANAKRLEKEYGKRKVLLREGVVINLLKMGSN